MDGRARTLLLPDQITWERYFPIDLLKRQVHRSSEFPRKTAVSSSRRPIPPPDPGRPAQTGMPGRPTTFSSLAAISARLPVSPNAVVTPSILALGRETRRARA